MTEGELVHSRSALMNMKLGRILDVLSGSSLKIHVSKVRNPISVTHCSRLGLSQNPRQQSTNVQKMKIYDQYNF